jgi:hypothetical protein
LPTDRSPPPPTQRHHPHQPPPTQLTPHPDSTPPPARYFGLTAYVTARVLFNTSEHGTGDSSPVVHMPVAEVKNPLNYLVVNTTKAPGGTEARREDPGTFFQSLALFVLSPNRAVFETIRDAYVEAGLSPHAANYYPISGQTVSESVCVCVLEGRGERAIGLVVVDGLID